jgi:hypothetical protein
MNRPFARCICWGISRLRHREQLRDDSARPGNYKTTSRLTSEQNLQWKKGTMLNVYWLHQLSRAIANTHTETSTCTVQLVLESLLDKHAHKKSPNVYLHNWKALNRTCLTAALHCSTASAQEAVQQPAPLATIQASSWARLMAPAPVVWASS